MNLTEFRSSVTGLFDGQDLLPVYGYVPGDVNELPAIVVGPPELGDGDEAGTFDLSLSLYVLGRRIGDEDSQDELTEYADHAVAILGGTKGRRHGGSVLALTRAAPSLVTVAGNDIPSYILTVEASTVTC